MLRSVRAAHRNLAGAQPHWARRSSAGAAAVAAAATAAAAAAIATGVTTSPAHTDASITANRPLAPRHRVALCGWPIKGARQSGSDPRVATLRSLFDHCRESGYDGIEFGCDDLKEMGFFPWSTPNREVAAVVQREAAAARFPATPRGTHYTSKTPAPCALHPAVACRSRQ